MISVSHAQPFSLVNGRTVIAALLLNALNQHSWSEILVSNIPRTIPLYAKENIFLKKGSRSLDPGEYRDPVTKSRPSTCILVTSLGRKRRSVARSVSIKTYTSARVDCQALRSALPLPSLESL